MALNFSIVDTSVCKEAATATETVERMRTETASASVQGNWIVSTFTT